MSIVERAGLAVLHRLDPERAHDLAIAALRTGLVPQPGPITTRRLACTLAGLDLPNPLGLAAGFDKNARAVGPLSRTGFGFIELGAVTPRPQTGNPRPRLFRLDEDRGAINRFGFNNDGVEAVALRLARRPDDAVIGLNLGANKDSADRAADFAQVLERTRDRIDFATVNVSSPNTERLRDLQGAEALDRLLEGVMAVRGGCPVFLKIAPDLTMEELAQIVPVAERRGVAAIVATNTTLDRTGLRSRHAGEAGGLSGAPLFDRSTRVLAALSGMTELPLVGVGGIDSAETAYAKIRAGAHALQLYTALSFRGFGLVREILTGLDALLARDGFATVAQAVGTGRDSPT
jgi:dihydroorotate dehydrogenase